MREGDGGKGVGTGVKRRGREGGRGGGVGVKRGGGREEVCRISMPRFALRDIARNEGRLVYYLSPTRS